MPATTHYGWVMPAPGMDDNAWGAILNTAIQAIDTELGRDREFNVLRDGADPSGVNDSLPAFLAARTRLTTAGGGVLKVPPGVYKLGDGWSEPGSIFWLNMDRMIFDARGAKILGMVLVGDSNPAVCPKDVVVMGGVYAPETSTAPPNAGLYFSHSNACGIASGVNVKFLGVTCVAAAYVRGFSIQTNHTYTGNGGVPIQNVTVLGLTIHCDNAPDALDISCEGADGLIRDIVVQGVSTGTPQRAIHCSAGGTPWRIHNATIDWLADGGLHYGAQLYYLKDSRVRLLAANLKWVGVDINGCDFCDMDLDVSAVPDQNPNQPPAGSMLTVNSNFGCAVSGSSMNPMVIRLRARGPFRSGLLPAKNGAHYPEVYVEGCSGAAIVSGSYTHTFGSVRLLNVGSVPTFGGAGEVYQDVRQFSAAHNVWQGIHPEQEMGAGTALVWRTENRTNNGGGAARLRPTQVGSGAGGIALDVGGGGAGWVNGLLAGLHDGSSAKLGFFSATPVSKPVVAGSTGGNAALQSLLAALASLGLITNNTTG